MLQGRLRRYVVAVAIFLLALGVRLALEPLVHGRLPFITFFPALIFTAFLSGLLPSLVLLLASAVAGNMLLATAGGDPFPFSLGISTLFVLVGVTVIVLVHYLVTISQRLKLHDQRLEIANRELVHRLKNVLALSSAVFAQTLRSGVAGEEAIEVATARLQALGAAQEQLAAARWEGADLEALTRACLQPMAPRADRLGIAGPPVRLAQDDAMPFALALHELATNAIKHGAWSGPAGRIDISWHGVRARDDSELLDLEWRETGGPLVAPPVREGFGHRLITSGLGAVSASFDFAPEGLACRVTLKVR